MPTLYNPVLIEGESVWSTPAKAIMDHVIENRCEILDRLNFHQEHGRLGEVDGKFDDQIKVAQDEVLAEISGVLALAAALVAEPQTGVILATLQWIRRHPSAAQNYSLPGFAEWLLAPHYQRADEEIGTFFPDVMGFVPNGFNGTIQIPGEPSIVKAALAAMNDLSRRRRRGRPSSVGNQIMGTQLRAIFLRYNDRATRRSETSWKDGKLVQVEAGAFFDFVSATIVPLQEFFRALRLSPPTVQSIVRGAGATQFLA